MARSTPITIAKLIYIFLTVLLMGCSISVRKINVGENEDYLSSIRMVTHLDPSFDERAHEILQMALYSDLTDLGFYVYPPLLSNYITTHHNRLEEEKISDAILSIDIRQNIANTESVQKEIYYYEYRIYDTRTQEEYWSKKGEYVVKTKNESRRDDMCDSEGNPKFGGGWGMSGDPGHPAVLLIYPIVIIGAKIYCSEHADQAAEGKQLNATRKKEVAKEEKRGQERYLINEEYFTHVHMTLINEIQKALPKGPYLKKVQTDTRMWLPDFDIDTMSWSIKEMKSVQ